MPDEDGPTVVKLHSTSGALPGLDLRKKALVYEAATESSPDEYEPPCSKGCLRWIFLARVLSLVPPAWWAVAAVGTCAITQHGPCLVWCM